MGNTPPSIRGISESCYANVTLYVPKGTLVAYNAAEEWKKFSKIVEFDTTDILVNGKTSKVSCKQYLSILYRRSFIIAFIDKESNESTKTRMSYKAN